MAELGAAGVVMVVVRNLEPHRRLLLSLGVQRMFLSIHLVLFFIFSLQFYANTDVKCY